MWETEFIKQVALLMLVGVVLGSAAGLFFIRSSFRNKSKLREKESILEEATWAFAVTLALLWPLGVFLLPSFFYNRPAIDGDNLTSLLQFVGIGLWMVGGGTIILSARELGKSFSPLIEVRESSTLVTTGPYSIVRHPIYLGIIVAGIGQSVAFLSVPLFMVTIAIIILARYRAGKEEELLNSPEAFGKEYSEYSSRTGSLFPRFK